MEQKLFDSTVTFRKWKGKDKRNFVTKINSGDVTPNDVINSLVYECITSENKDSIVLTVDEYRYILTQIRIASFGDDVSFYFDCDECGESFEDHRKLSELIKYTCNPTNLIEVDDIKIELQPLKNRKIYNNIIDINEMNELFLRIKSINGNDAMTFDEVVDFFDELDVDIMEKIWNAYIESAFRIDDENDVTCPNCGDVVKYSFDEIDGFLPNSWLGIN